MSSWRSQFREDNRLLAELLAGPFGKLYLAGATATFFFNFGERLKICPDTLACWLSMLKNLIWSLVWPLWWVMFATDFSAIHAVLGR